ncbi:MAG: SPFH domain-containing protein [Candidatus Paceibacterota bacterium]|jgi:hypothetical protein
MEGEATLKSKEKIADYKKRRFYTQIENGYCKIIVRYGEFRGGLLNYDGYKFDREWNIVPLSPGEKSHGHFLGGIRFFSINPLDYIYEYPWEWTSVNQRGEKDHHDLRIIDYVFLKSDLYYADILAPLDSNQVRLASVGIIYTAKVVNPKKALFDCENWMEMLVNKTGPVIRDVIGEKTLESMVKEKGDLGATFMKMLREKRLPEDSKGNSEEKKKGAGYSNERSIIEELLIDYGIELSDIQVQNIMPPPDWEKIIAAKYIATKEKEAAIEKAEGEKKAAILKAEGSKAAAFLYKDGEEAMIKMLIERFGKEEGAAIYQTALLTVSSLVVDLKSEHIRGIGSNFPEIAKSLTKKPDKRKG